MRRTIKPWEHCFVTVTQFGYSWRQTVFGVHSSTDKEPFRLTPLRRHLKRKQEDCQVSEGEVVGTRRGGAVEK